MTWLASVAGAAMVCLAAPLLGATSINLRRVFDTSIPFADNIDGQIFFVARLPARAGGRHGGLGTGGLGCGLSGALEESSRHAVYAQCLGRRGTGRHAGADARCPPALPVFWVPIASFAGSLGAVAIVYALARAKHRGLSTNVLLLAGVTLNSLFSALILFVQFLADYTQTFRTVRWLMGDLDVSSFGPLLAALPPLALSFAAFAVLPKRLNLLSVSDESAASRGVGVMHPAPGISQRASPPVRPFRWAVPLASSASSFPTSSGSSSAPTTGSCFRHRHSAVRHFSWRAIRFPARRCRPSRCPSASSPPSSAVRFFYGCS